MAAAVHAVRNTAVAEDRVAALAVGASLELPLSHTPSTVWNLQFFFFFGTVEIRHRVLTRGTDFLASDYRSLHAASDGAF